MTQNRLIAYIVFSQTVFCLPITEPRIETIRKVIPPTENPYPARDQVETNRVSFAKQVIELFWAREYDARALNQGLYSSGYRAFSENAKQKKKHENKSLECLYDQKCWQRDVRFADFVAGIQSMRYAFRNPRILWCHTIPWTQESLKSKAARPPDQLAVLKKQELAYRHVVEPRAFMLSPLGLAADEYVVDCVVQFEKRDDWQHVLLVMAEASNALLYLRRIDVQQIQDITRPTLYH